MSTPAYPEFKRLEKPEGFDGLFGALEKSFTFTPEMQENFASTVVLNPLLPAVLKYIKQYAILDRRNSPFEKCNDQLRALDRRSPLAVVYKSQVCHADLPRDHPLHPENKDLLASKQAQRAQEQKAEASVSLLCYVV